jgi:hypothetical protein
MAEAALGVTRPAALIVMAFWTRTIVPQACAARFNIPISIKVRTAAPEMAEHVLQMQVVAPHIYAARVAFVATASTMGWCAPRTPIVVQVFVTQPTVVATRSALMPSERRASIRKRMPDQRSAPAGELSAAP